MKKKITFILSLVLMVIVISASAVLAKDNNDPGENSSIFSMFDSMRDWLEQERGDITEDEAEAWEKHIGNMEEFHKKNGFKGHCGKSNDINRNDENQNSTP